MRRGRARVRDCGSSLSNFPRRDVAAGADVDRRDADVVQGAWGAQAGAPAANCRVTPEGGRPAVALGVVALVDEVLDLGFVEQAGVDAELVVKAFDFETDDAVDARPREEGEQQDARVGALAASADLAPSLDLAL